MDEEEYESKNGLITSGWQWKKIHSYELTAGDHVFKIAYRENGAHLDKISISNYGFLPEDLGEVAGNICIPDTSSVGIDMPDQVSGIELFQNYPNPFAEKTNISFEISGKTFVSIKIYNLLGSEVKELINEVYDPGKYSIVTDMDNLTEGIYFYRMNAGNFTAGRKMILCPEY